MSLVAREVSRQDAIVSGPIQTPVVIYSPDKGVFLGRGSSGALHWTGDDQVVTGAAVCYPSPDDAASVITEIGIDTIPNIYLCAVVPDVTLSNGAKFASVHACIEAMLPAWMSPWTVEQERAKTRRNVQIH